MIDARNAVVVWVRLKVDGRQIHRGQNLRNAAINRTAPKIDDVLVVKFDFQRRVLVVVAGATCFVAGSPWGNIFEARQETIEM